MSLKLPEAMMQALRQIAQAEDVSVGQLVRNAVSRDLNRAPPPRSAQTRAQTRAQALLAEDFAFATSWDDLFARLYAKGYYLDPTTRDLVLRSTEHHGRVGALRDMGLDQAALLRRLRTASPRTAGVSARLRADDPALRATAPRRR